MVSATPNTIYFDRLSRLQKVTLKFVKGHLHNAEHFLKGFAILDDVSERILILPLAVRDFHLTKEPERLPLRPVRHEMLHLQDTAFSVDIQVMPLNRGIIFIPPSPLMS